MYIPARAAGMNGYRKRGMGQTPIPYPYDASTFAAAPAPTSSGIVWTDCPDGSTVPASVGCPSYGSTISSFLGANQNTVLLVSGLLLGAAFLFKR